MISGYLLYSKVSIANNIVYLKFAKKVGHVLSVLTMIIINKKKRKGRKLWEMVNVYSLDGGDGFMGIYLPQTH